MGQAGKPVRPEPRRVGKHQRLIHPDKPVQIFVGARAGSALRQVPRAPEASTSGDSPSTPHRRLRPHVRKAHWQSYWKGKPTQGEEENYAAEMEATTNRQWQGRRFSGSRHQIHERHRQIILN